MMRKKYCKRDVLQSIIDAYRDAFDENRKNFPLAKVSGLDEIKISKSFSSKIARLIDDTGGEMGKYAIPCYDRLSKRINELEGCKEIIDRTITETLDNNDYRIIMILESPNKYEYCGVVPGDLTRRPLPANVLKGGKTGCRIRDIFVPLVLKNEFCNWRIGLINPIQYSCSLGGMLSPERKDEMFVALFQDVGFREDFVRRLDMMCRVSNYIVTNCCTSPNSILVDDILKQRHIPFIKMAHPSSPCFAKQCKENTSQNCNSCCKTILYKPNGASYMSFARTLSVDVLLKAMNESEK